MNRYTKLVSQVAIMTILGLATTTTATTKLEISVNDGTMIITPSEVINGTQNGAQITNGIFFVPCHTIESFGTDVFYEVVMGDYTDYLIPMKGASGCDVLSGATVNLPDIGRTVNKYYYSPISPLNDKFEGTNTYINPLTDVLGGSSELELKERDKLNIWGTKKDGKNSLTSSTVGGCCKLKSTQSFSWHMPYTITAYKFDVTKTYLQILEAPSTVFVNEAFKIIVQLGDIYRNAVSNTHIMHNTCDFWMLVGVALKPVIFDGNPCRVTFTHTITVLSKTPTAMNLYNGNTLINKLSVNTVPLPPGFKALSVNEKVKKVLGWNLVKDKGKFPSFVMFNSSKLSSPVYYHFFSVRDNKMKPFPGMKDMIKVPKSWSDVIRKEPGSWLTTSADSEGRFGSGIMVDSSVQYFAFTLYISERQRVKFNFNCVDKCSVHVGGSSRSSNTAYTLSEGYHQVIVKTLTTSTTGPTTGFTFELSEGYSIAVGLEAPFNNPPGTKVLAPGKFVTEFLTVKKPFEGSYDTDYLVMNNSDATVKPKLKDPLFMRVTNSVGDFSVRGNGATGKRMVNYFSAGLLASNDGRITISLPVVGGSTTIWLDGNMVYFARGTIEDGDEFGLKVTEGWHQLLIKVYVSESDDDWMFKMKVLESDNTVVYAALQIPNGLPEGASDILKKPINMIISPKNSLDKNEIPFNFNDTADRAYSDPTFSVIDVTKIELYESKVEINGNNWTWKLVFGSDGVFTINSGSGADNRYYAFVLYFTESVAQLNLSVMHYSGIGMWIDGKQVLAKTSESDGDIVTFNNIEKGWHQFHLRLQTPKNMDLLPMQANDNPNHMCAKNGFNLCIQKSDICLDDVPKPGYPLPESNLAYAAFSRFYVGISGDNLCKTFPYPNVTDGKRYAACCGTSKTTTKMSIRVIGYTGNAVIGWAMSIPFDSLEKPTFITQEEDGYTLVTIKCTNAAEKIYFMINGGSYELYTKPINVTTSADIKAYAELDGRISPTNIIIISDLHKYKISRSECPAYVPCAVKLSDGIHKVTGSYVVLVNKFHVSTVTNVLRSSKYARAGGNGFTKLLRVYKSGIFMTPDFGNNDHFSFRYSRSIPMRMIVFPAGADNADEPGILVHGSIVVSVLNVVPADEVTKSLKRLSDAPIEVSGGVVAGDFVTFPQLQSNTSNCDTNTCLLSMNTSESRHMIGPKGVAVFVDLLSFGGDELKCICVSAVGGSDIPSENVLTKHYQPVAIPISIIITEADTVSNEQKLLSFSPSVVSKGDTMHISGYFEDSATVTFRCAHDIVKRCSHTLPIFTMIKTPLRLNSDAFLREAQGSDVTAKRYKLQKFDGIVSSPDCTSTFGVWRVVMSSDGRLLKVHGNSQPMVAFIPSPPIIVSMSGPCATMSANCINGTVIDFIGSGFISEDPKHNEVILMDGNDRSKTVSCIPVSVSETVLSCLLIIIPDEEGKYLMELGVNVATLVTASDDVHFGAFPKSVYVTNNSMILNGGERKGWTGQTALKTDSETNECGSKSGNTTGIVVGVIFAILLVVILVGGVFVYKKYRINKDEPLYTNPMKDTQHPLVTHNSIQDSVPLAYTNQESRLSPALSPRAEDFDSEMSSDELSPRNSDDYSPTPTQSPRAADL